MWNLAKPEPCVCELIAAQGDRPPVVVTFNPQPSPLSLRAARRAVAEILRDGEPDAIERAGDAFSQAIIRYNIVSWTGLGDEADDQAIAPTPDRELRDAAGEVTGIEPGSISAFLAEPRLVEAADREYVMPWTKRDAEKNGSAPSSNGTSAGATPVAGTASSPATPAKPAAAKRARTSRKSPGRTPAKPSGSSSRG